ncbi:MAG: alanine racemase [Ruminococcus sp.]|nr:alanine racemase [Ruminococcus sp.]
MERYRKRTWCEIDLNALKYNVDTIKSITDKKIIAVVKANAYGHGDIEIATELQNLGIDYFAVSNLDEGIKLREHGILGEILILGYTPVEEAEMLQNYNIVQAILGYDYAIELNKSLEEKGSTARVHIAIDTGMNRIGFIQNEHNDTLEDIKKVYALKNLKIDGIFTHLCVADSFRQDNVDFTEYQLNNLDTIVAELKKSGYDCGLVHAQNSAGLTNLKKEQYGAVRAGIILYGLNPSNDVRKDIVYKPIMALKSVVSMVKYISKGDTVGYGRTFKADKTIKVATVTAGYADGYSRLLSNKGEVLIHGIRCKIIGNVCMDQFMVDVSNIDNVKSGDIVTLVGTDGNETITLDELANIIGTINYELACNINLRASRVYIK